MELYILFSDTTSITIYNVEEYFHDTKEDIWVIKKNNHSAYVNNSQVRFIGVKSDLTED